MDACGRPGDAPDVPRALSIQCNLMCGSAWCRQDGGCGKQESEEHGEVGYHMEAVHGATLLDPVDGQTGRYRFVRRISTGKRGSRWCSPLCTSNVVRTRVWWRQAALSPI